MVAPKTLIPPGLARFIGGIKDQIPITNQTIGAATHRDAYEVLRRVGTQTDAGTKSFTELVVESGMGSLDVRNVLTGEGVRAEAVGPSSAYTMTLPLDTVATPKDTIRVAGRLFAITGVTKGGHYAAFATANLEEKG